MYITVYMYSYVYGLVMVYLSIVMSIHDWLFGLPWIDRNWRLKQ